jgi:hypothetical protein
VAKANLKGKRRLKSSKRKMKTKKQKSAKTICFTVANLLGLINEDKKNETLIFKAFLKRGLAIGGRLTEMLLHALCVFLCTPLFEP